MDTFEREWAEKTGASFFESTTFPFSVPSLDKDDLRFSGITPIKPSASSSTAAKKPLTDSTKEHRRNSDSHSKMNIPELPEFTWEEFDTTSSDIDQLGERVQKLLNKKDESEAVRSSGKAAQLGILTELDITNDSLDNHNLDDVPSSRSPDHDDILTEHYKTKNLPPISFSTYLLSDYHRDAIRNSSQNNDNNNDNKNNKRNEIESKVDQALANIHKLKERILAPNDSDSLTEESTTDSATMFNAHSIETVKTNASTKSSASKNSSQNSVKSASKSSLKSRDSNNNPSVRSGSRDSTSNSGRLESDTVNSILGLNLTKTNSSSSLKSALKSSSSSSTSRPLPSKVRSSTKIDCLLDSSDSIEYLPISPLKKNNSISRKIESILKDILQEDDKASSKTSSQISKSDSKSLIKENSSKSQSKEQRSTSSLTERRSQISESRKNSSNASRSSSSGLRNSISAESNNQRRLSSSKTPSTTAAAAARVTSTSNSVQSRTVVKSPPKIGDSVDNKIKNHKSQTTVAAPAETAMITNSSVQNESSSVALLEDSLQCSSTSSLPEPNRTIQEQCHLIQYSIERNANSLKQVQKELLQYERLQKLYGKETKKKVQFEDGHVSFDGIQSINANTIVTRNNNNHSATEKKKKFTKDQIEYSRIQHQKAKLERKIRNEELSDSSLISSADNACSSLSSSSFGQDSEIKTTTTKPTKTTTTTTTTAKTKPKTMDWRAGNVKQNCKNTVKTLPNTVNAVGVQCRETRPKSLSNTKKKELHSFNNEHEQCHASDYDEVTVQDDEENDDDDDEEPDDDYEEASEMDSEEDCDCSSSNCKTNDSFTEQEEYHDNTGKVQKSNKMCGKVLRSRSSTSKAPSSSSSVAGHCYCCIVHTERQIRLRSHCVKRTVKNTVPPNKAQSKMSLRGNRDHNRIEMNSSPVSETAPAPAGQQTARRSQHTDKRRNTVQSSSKRSTVKTTQPSQAASERVNSRNMAKDDDYEFDFSLDYQHDDHYDDERYSDASRASSAAYVANVNRSVQTSIMIDNSSPRQRTPSVNSSSLFSGNGSDPFFNPRKPETPVGSRRPIVYFLPLDSVPTNPSPPRKNSRETLRHSMIQVPVKSCALPAPELTIQEAFRQRCTAFRQRSAARVRRIQASAEQRIETADQRRRAIAQTYAAKREQEERSKSGVKPIVIRSIPYNGKKLDNKGLTHKEMRAQTEKIYRRLPEARAADKWAKKEDDAKRRRVMADIFKQRLKENAIRGKLNWPITTLAITAL